jgi:hypothetical protein
MFWDDLVRRWRHESRVISPRLLSGAGGHVAVLPQRRRRRSRLLMVLLTLLAIEIALLIGSGRVSVQRAETGTPLGAAVMAMRLV